jgi:hypothetical protein
MGAVLFSGFVYVAKGDAPLTARDKIDFPSPPSPRVLQESSNRRAAGSSKVFVRLQLITSSLLGSGIHSDRPLRDLNDG